MPEPTPTPKAPAAAEPQNPATPPAAGATPPAVPPAAPKTPPWGSDENFKPAEAWELIQNLRKEKAPDTSALESRLSEMQASTEARNKALAEALGLSEPPKSEDALAETVKNLQTKFEASQLEALKLRLAASPGVDAEGKPLPAIPPEFHDLLTETDPEKLSAQAEKVGALIAANAAAPGTPMFQANPGQGQGGQSSQDAQDEAEYRRFYPSPPNRK